jgi:RNA polymerase sigma factor (sigma-70 family)
LSQTEIEDVLSTATFKVWRGADLYDADKGTLRAWFFRIAHNAGQEVLRDRQRRRWETRGDAIEHVEHVVEIPSTPPRAFLATLRECIQKLPKMQRQIIEADLKCGEVADAGDLAKTLRTTKNSVYASRSIARKTLKRALLERGYSPGEGRSQLLWQ